MKQTPDRKQALALRQAAGRVLERLEQTEQKRYPSETIKDYYDILHTLLEAKATEDGIKFIGVGAHRDLIDYYVGSEKERQLLQRLREYRNRILYEGFEVTQEYLERKEIVIRQLIKRLQKI